MVLAEATYKSACSRIVVYLPRSRRRSCGESVSTDCQRLLDRRFAFPFRFAFSRRDPRPVGYFAVFCSHCSVEFFTPISLLSHNYHHLR